jgi:hypothetical protein
MILTGSDILRITTTSAATLSVYAAYTDHGRERSARGRTSTAISSATTTTVLAGPGAPAQREVGMLAVANTHASTSNTVTIEHYDGATATRVWAGALAAGESVVYVAGAGWEVRNTAGVPKAAPAVGPGSPSVLMSPAFATGNLTSVRSLTATNTYAVYVGRAPRALTSASVRYRVTTAAVTVTWAEVAMARGSVNVGGSPTLTVVGYADVSGVVTATGQFTTSVPVSAGQSISEGDDLWVLLGNNASTVEVVRAQSIADDLQVGVAAWLSTRPSLNVGSAQVYTAETAAALPAWVALVV